VHPQNMEEKGIGINFFGNRVSFKEEDTLICCSYSDSELRGIGGGDVEVGIEKVIEKISRPGFVLEAGGKKPSFK
jgi:hypothetical protein